MLIKPSVVHTLYRNLAHIYLPLSSLSMLQSQAVAYRWVVYVDLWKGLWIGDANSWWTRRGSAFNSGCHEPHCYYCDNIWCLVYEFGKNVCYLCNERGPVHISPTHEIRYHHRNSRNERGVLSHVTAVGCSHPRDDKPLTLIPLSTSATHSAASHTVLHKPSLFSK